MRVHAEGNRRVPVAELPTHVGDRRAVVKEQACERVPHLVRTTTVEAGSIQNPVERLADVRLIERGTSDGGEHPFREQLPMLQPRSALLAPPQPKHCPQLP
jgi:hypothetical protein